MTFSAIASAVMWSARLCLTVSLFIFYTRTFLSILSAMIFPFFTWVYIWPNFPGYVYTFGIIYISAYLINLVVVIVNIVENRLEKKKKIIEDIILEYSKMKKPLSLDTIEELLNTPLWKLERLYKKIKRGDIK